MMSSGFGGSGPRRLTKRKNLTQSGPILTEQEGEIKVGSVREREREFGQLGLCALYQMEDSRGAEES